MMAARVVTSPSFAVTARDTLFAGPYMTDPWHPNYDVMPDGKGFVMVRPVEQDRQLIMVMNWGEELRREARPGPRQERTRSRNWSHDDDTLPGSPRRGAERTATGSSASWARAAWPPSTSPRT